MEMFSVYKARPFAYKEPSAIIDNVKDSIEIDEQIKPKYNYKD